MNNAFGLAPTSIGRARATTGGKAPRHVCGGNLLAGWRGGGDAFGGDDGGVGGGNIFSRERGKVDGFVNEIECSTGYDGWRTLFLLCVSCSAVYTLCLSCRSSKSLSLSLTLSISLSLSLSFYLSYSLNHSAGLVLQYTLVVV